MTSSKLPTLDLVSGGLSVERRDALAVSRRVSDRRAVLDWRVPPWRAWRASSRAARAIRWIETYVRIPYGPRAGQRLKLHGFQRDVVEALLADDVSVGGLQICRGNAKSTLVAALGLWALSDEADAPQVPLVAHDARHADRTLFQPMRRMIDTSEELRSRIAVYTSSGDHHLESPWNSGQLWPLPAASDRLQGLNPTIAIVDEAQTVPDEIVWSIRQGAGKRGDTRVLVIGTPGPDKDCALWHLRDLVAADSEAGAFVEYSAPEGSDLLDRGAWRTANPGIETGILDERVLVSEARAVSHGHANAVAMFQMYRLGWWIDHAAGWLPAGCWDACPRVEAPEDGTEIVLAVDGTYRRSTAVVGATLDGAVFLVWAAEAATDDDLGRVLDVALDRWSVVELAYFARVRTDLMRRYAEAGVDCYAWHGKPFEEITSANEFHRAIVEGAVGHDHHPLLAEHLGNVRAQISPDGLRLRRPTDVGKWIDAGMAARMAWWRARQTEASGPRMFTLGSAS